jgi:hypothetical protein
MTHLRARRIMFVQTIQSFIWVQTLRRPRQGIPVRSTANAVFPFLSLLRGGLFLPQCAVNHAFVSGGVSPKFA